MSSLLGAETIKEVNKMIKTITCARCELEVLYSSAIIRTRSLREVLAWHEECYQADHPRELPEQRRPHPGS